MINAYQVYSITNGKYELVGTPFRNESDAINSASILQIRSAQFMGNAVQFHVIPSLVLASEVTR